MKQVGKDPHRYDDMINLPHYRSDRHPRMSEWSRAAQFAPFAALNGYGDAILETQRRTDQRIELDESEQAILDEKLRMLLEQMEMHPEVKITYFIPDEKKDGGAYVTVTGTISKMDRYAHSIRMADGTVIPMEMILEIDSQIF